MKKRLLLTLALGSVLTVGGVTAIANVGVSPIGQAAEAATYALTLDADQAPAGLSTSSFGKGSLSISGKSLDLDYFDAKSVSGSHVALKSGSGYIASSHVRGLSKIKVTFSGATSLTLKTGLLDSDLKSFALTSGVEEEIDGSYFKLINSDSSDATISSIELTYSCRTEGLASPVSALDEDAYRNVGSDFAAQKYSLAKATNSGATYSNQSYVDLGEYDNGALVTMTFTGKYKPQVALFTEAPSATPSADGNTGMLFTDDWIGSDYRIYKNFQGGCVVNGKSELSPIAYNNLDASATYTLTVGAIRKNDNQYTCSAYLYDASGTLLTSYVQDRGITDFNLTGKHVVLYGSRIARVDFTASIRSAYHASAYNPGTGAFALLKNSDASTSYTNASYIDLGDKFYNGATLKLTLDTNAIYLPTIQFFADKADPSFKAGAMNGITLHGDSIGTQYRAYSASSLASAFITSDAAFAGYSTMKSAREGHTLEFSVTVKKADKYYVAYSLYDVTADESVGSVSKEYAFSYSSIQNNAGIGGHIVIYGSRVTNLGGTISVETVY